MRTRWVTFHEQKWVRSCERRGDRRDLRLTGLRAHLRRLPRHQKPSLRPSARGCLTRAGLAAARRVGRTGGRPPKLTDDDIEAAKAMLATPDIGDHAAAVILPGHRFVARRIVAAG
jgi:hypothetical protein